MNDNFDFNPNNVEMSKDEKKRHRGVFSGVCLAFVAYLLSVEVLVVITRIILTKFAPHLLGNYNASIVISSVLQYAIAFPIFFLIIKRIPKDPPVKQSLSIGRFIKYWSVAMVLMFVGNNVSMEIMFAIENAFGSTPSNAVDEILSNTNTGLSIVFAGIIGPIVEELMCRKLTIDRLSPYGDAVAIFFPALIFGLLHGNLYQFFYAFLLGVAFSYIYLRTGKIIYSIILHIFINLFCGVFPSYILGMFDYEEFVKLAMEGGITEEMIEANLLPLTLLGIYEIVFYTLLFMGAFKLFRGIRSIYFHKGFVRLPKGEGASIMFFNVGAIILIIYCTITIALNTIPAPMG